MPYSPVDCGLTRTPVGGPQAAAFVPAKTSQLTLIALALLRVLILAWLKARSVKIRTLIRAGWNITEMIELVLCDTDTKNIFYRIILWVIW